MASTAQAASLPQNIASMYVLQGAGYLIPFFTLPFLVRTLGTEGFGLLALSQAVVMFLVMFVDSGFNQSASRDVAMHRDDPARLSEIYWSTQLVRVGLGVIGSLLLAVAVWSVDAWRNQWEVFLIQGLMLLGTLSLPVWYFAGLEQMKQVAIYSIAARIMSAVAIFALVRTPQDVAIAAACQASATLIGGIAIHWKILRNELPWKRPSRQVLNATYARGKSLFASEFVTGVAGNGNVVLLGIFASAEAVGIYAAIDKLVRALESLALPIMTGFSPRITRAYSASRREAIRVSRRIMIWLTATAAVVAGLLALNAARVLDLLFGLHLAEFDEALQGMSLWLMLSCINLGILEFWFIAPGQFSRLSRLLVISVIVQLVLVAGMTAAWGLPGLVTAVVVAKAAALILAWRMLVADRERPDQ